MAGWLQAWRREQGRGWTVDTAAHVTLQAIDGGSPGNSFRKQMMALPDALVPAVEDRAASITVVRHEDEVGYTKKALDTLSTVVFADMEPSPLACFVMMEPPFLARRGYRPPHRLLTSARYFRSKASGFFVGWHEVEFPSCPIMIRSAHYPRVTPWWAGVEVPYGAMVEMPPALTYLKDKILANNPWAWNVFRSEWAVLCGAYLMDEYRSEGRLWLYPRPLRQWVHRVGLETICGSPYGVDATAVEELGALLALLDQLPMTAAFTAQLRARDPERRDRTSWVRARVELVDGTPTATVDEDLAPFLLPYTRDVLESREMGVEETIVAATPSPTSRRPAGTTPAGPSNPRPVEEGPEAPVVRILMASPLAHRDVPDEILAHMDGLVPDRVGAVLAPFLGATPEDALPRVGPLVAGLLHTLAELGTQVTTWASQQEGRPSTELQKLIDLVGQSTLRNLLAREVGLAEAAAQRVYVRRVANTTLRIRSRDDTGEGSGQGRATRPREHY